MAKLTFVYSLPAQYDKVVRGPYVVIRKFNSKYTAYTARLRSASIPDLKSVHASTEHGSFFAS